LHHGDVYLPYLSNIIVSTIDVTSNYKYCEYIK
jgi:hypothetical protein